MQNARYMCRVLLVDNPLCDRDNTNRFRKPEVLIGFIIVFDFFKLTVGFNDLIFQL